VTLVSGRACVVMAAPASMAECTRNQSVRPLKPLSMVLVIVLSRARTISSQTPPAGTLAKPPHSQINGHQTMSGSRPLYRR
jgi:hypothetical protein